MFVFVRSITRSAWQAHMFCMPKKNMFGINVVRLMAHPVSIILIKRVVQRGKNFNAFFHVVWKHMRICSWCQGISVVATIHIFYKSLYYFVYKYPYIDSEAENCSLKFFFKLLSGLFEVSKLTSQADWFLLQRKSEFHHFFIFIFEANVEEKCWLSGKCWTQTSLLMESTMPESSWPFSHVLTLIGSPENL